MTLTTETFSLIWFYSEIQTALYTETLIFFVAFIIGIQIKVLHKRYTDLHNFKHTHANRNRSCSICTERKIEQCQLSLEILEHHLSKCKSEVRQLSFIFYFFLRHLKRVPNQHFPLKQTVYYTRKFFSWFLSKPLRSFVGKEVVHF